MVKQLFAKKLIFKNLTKMLQMGCFAFHTISQKNQFCPNCQYCAQANFAPGLFLIQNAHKHNFIEKEIL